MLGCQFCVYFYNFVLLDVGIVFDSVVLFVLVLLYTRLCKVIVYAGFNLFLYFLFTTAFGHQHQRCDVESSSGEVYLTQHYVIKVVSDFRQVDGFHRILRSPQQNKIDRHDIAEILLKVELNTLILILTLYL